MTRRITANYVSNISLSESSGGWSGFNAAMYATLSRHFAMRYVGPIAPSADTYAKLTSKVARITGRPRSFQFFSERRLSNIARDVSARATADAAFDFFHGSTPWISYTPAVPYACYLDVSFATYLRVYHEEAHFDDSDVSRIEKREAEWLRGATRVFFSSAWALEETARSYALDASSLRVAGMGGHIPVPNRDCYAGGKEFLFIALDFEGKGGRVCVDAFRKVMEAVPDVTLRIVGAKPPNDVLEIAGISYEGRLDKGVSVQMQRLQEIFAQAFALVHPTTKDATPQVIVEAAYHGCPAIGPSSFGIPGMIANDVTGCLVPAPPTASAVAECMIRLLRNESAYRSMRTAARRNALGNFTWERVGDRIAAELTPLLS